MDSLNQDNKELVGWLVSNVSSMAKCKIWCIVFEKGVHWLLVTVEDVNNSRGNVFPSLKFRAC